MVFAIRWADSRFAPIQHDVSANGSHFLDGAGTDGLCRCRQNEYRLKISSDTAISESVS